MKRFWDKVRKGLPNECWLWIGAKNSAGYGNFAVDRKYLNAHRMSWILLNGDIPNSMVIRHTCDIPACVNPNHLLIGTHLDNRNDMVSRRRDARGERHPARYKPSYLKRGEDSHYSKLNNWDVRFIRHWLNKNYRPRWIAPRFSVSETAIHDIRHGRTWAHIH